MPCQMVAFSGLTVSMAAGTRSNVINHGDGDVQGTYANYRDGRERNTADIASNGAGR